MKTSKLDNLEFPLLVSAECADTDKFKWVEENRAEIKQALTQHGALLFRGFDIDNADAMHDFCEALGGELMDYPRGTSPRNAVGDRIYTSTEVAPNLPLPIHTEMSYTSVYPQALVFCCAQPPQSGGETPLADMRKVLARLPKEVVDAFRDKGICYKQYCPSGHGNTRFKNWQDMFNTEERSVVEEKCREQDVTVKWLKDGAAYLKNVRPAVNTHPVTGEESWFNQVHIFHPSMSLEFGYLGRPVMAKLIRIYELMLENLGKLMPPYPYGCSFGDGSPVPREYIKVIRQAIWDETVSFPWRKGDLLIVDNMRLGHGRFPYKGDRKVLAALLKKV